MMKEGKFYWNKQLTFIVKCLRVDNNTVEVLLVWGQPHLKLDIGGTYEVDNKGWVLLSDEEAMDFV